MVKLHNSFSFEISVVCGIKSSSFISSSTAAAAAAFGFGEAGLISESDFSTEEFSTDLSTESAASGCSAVVSAASSSALTSGNASEESAAGLASSSGFRLASVSVGVVSSITEVSVKLPGSVISF